MGINREILLVELGKFCQLDLAALVVPWASGTINRILPTCALRVVRGDLGEDASSFFACTLL